MTNRIGTGPIDPEYVEVMTALARGIDRILNGESSNEPKQTGFILMVFPLNGHEGRCNYMSNGKREDVVVLLREQLNRFEGYAAQKGRA